MHTLPSMEADAMYIEFDGVAGMGACWPDLGGPRKLPVLVGGRGRGVCSSTCCLVGASALKFGKGGGKGDIDIEVTLAECA